MLDDTIAAIATPLGEGGLAVIRLSGTQALALADRCFAPAGKSSVKPSAAPTHTIQFGHVVRDGQNVDEALVAVISAIYKEVWGPLQNFFLPCLKLQHKWREGSHWRRRYEPPRTAYERLCDPGILPRHKRRELRDLYESLDPLDLKDDLEERLIKVLRPASKARHQGGLICE